MDIKDIDVFIGIDVGKADHWATALNREGRKVLDKPLPNDEARLRSLYGKLADHGNLLVVVDQPATIGALAVTAAQDMGITVGYLPGLSMRRIADLPPGSAKTDAKDAAVIAGAARTMPHTLNRSGFDGGSDDADGSLSWDSRKYPDELRERATRMTLEALADPARAKGTIGRIGEELGVHPEALRTWVKKAQIDQGSQPGTTTDEAQRIKELEKEVRELRRAKAALRIWGCGRWGLSAG